MAPTERPVILLVEDEFLIRTHAAEVIRDAGFEVAEAANADEAIIILESRRDIRVVFTDIRMPRSMDGEAGTRGAGSLATGSHSCDVGQYALQEGDLPAGTVFFAEAI